MDVIPRYVHAAAVAAKLACEQNPDEIFQRVVDTLIRELDAALARVWTYDEVTNTLRLAAGDGPAAPPPGAGIEIPLDLATPVFWVDTVVRDRLPFVATRLDGDPRVDQSWAAGESIEGVAVVPIIFGGKLLGALAYFSHHELDPEIGEVLEAMAAGIASGMNAFHLVQSYEAAAAHARQAEDMLTAMLHAAPVPIFDLTPLGNIRRCNPAAERQLGWSRHDLLGRPLPVVLEKGEIDELHARAREGESITDVEARWEQKDETWRSVSLSIAPIHTESWVSGILAIVLDTAVRKAAKGALSDGTER